MKIFLFIAALFFLTMWSCTSARNDDCFDANLKATWADSVCLGGCNTPVCACNGVSYCNACEARKAGFEVIDTIPCGQR